MKKHESQRGWFAYSLYQYMKEDYRLFLVCADLGYKVFDSIKLDYPDSFLNCGASEQAGLDICVGMALSGRIPIFYTITPFLFRGFETIKLYLNGEKIKVIMVGSGRDMDYKHDGPSHDATHVKDFFKLLPNISQYYPDKKEQIPSLLKECIDKDGPSFISLTR